MSEADSSSSRYYTHFLPEHLQVLRWISDCSPLSRQAILHILDKCFHLPTPILDAEGAVRIACWCICVHFVTCLQLGVKRHVMDTLVHLLLAGHVLPVLARASEWSAHADPSIMRYFVLQAR